MPLSPRSTSGPDRFPAARPPALPPARGRVAVAVCLRAHLYGDAGRRVVRASSTVAPTVLPAGPLVRDPLTGLGLLETSGTVVVAERAMWDLLAESWVADEKSAVGTARPVGSGDPANDKDKDDDDTVTSDGNRSLLIASADQARGREELLESLRRHYGVAVSG